MPSLIYSSPEHSRFHDFSLTSQLAYKRREMEVEHQKTGINIYAFSPLDHREELSLEELKHVMKIIHLPIFPKIIIENKN